MNKGQIVSGDFIVSIAIFIIILAITIPMWFFVSSQIIDNENRAQIEIRGLILSDTLVKTSGSPSNWNSTNVSSIGFLDKGKLNVTKILNLLAFDYKDAKGLLGIAGLEFYLSITSNEFMALSGVAISPAAYFSVNNMDMKSLINGSGLVWDFYYGGAGSPDEGDSRNFYSASKIDAFNMVINNQSYYKTIIIENPELAPSEVDISGLKEFVTSGGILIYEGNATLIDDEFNMSASKASNRKGVVVNPDNFLDANINDNVTFDKSEWALDGTLNKIVVDKNDGRTLIGYWDYGYGRIYYISDINGTINGIDLKSLLNVVGNRLEYGNEPADADIIINMRRLAILHNIKDQLVNLNLVLWK